MLSLLFALCLYLIAAANSTAARKTLAGSQAYFLRPHPAGDYLPGFSPGSFQDALYRPFEADMFSLEVYNNCPYEVYPGVIVSPKKQDSNLPNPSNTGFRLPPGDFRIVWLPDYFQGRVWPRTDCVRHADGSLKCLVGDCDSKLECDRKTGDRGTLIFELMMASDHWYYDISAVDGFSTTGMECTPLGSLVGGTRYKTGRTLACAPPMEKVNRIFDADDFFAAPATCAARAVKSDCTKYGSAKLCCVAPYDHPETCLRGNFAAHMNRLCPDVYGYAFDDGLSTFGASRSFSRTVRITFCPAQERSMNRHKERILRHAYHPPFPNTEAMLAAVAIP